MEITNINAQALSQTYYIIDGMLEVNKNKLPLKLINNIREYMDQNYIYTKEQELFLETKQIIYAIFYKYILNEEQKSKLREYFDFYDIKEEKQKSEKFNISDIFKNNNKKEINIEKQVSLLEIKEEKFYLKIYNFLKNILKKH